MLAGAHAYTFMFYRHLTSSIACYSMEHTDINMDCDADLVDTQSLGRNYFRLARLTMIAGTEQIRKCILNNLPPGQTLHTVLDRNRNKMEDLRRRHVISERQWSLLYPQNSNVNLARIDITLWIMLLRTIIPLSRLPVRNIRWDKAPSNDEKEWVHDVLRIRETRNSLSHLIRPELDNDSFNRLWNYLGDALMRLDW